MMTELENKFTVSLDTIYKELTRDKITITKHLKNKNTIRRVSPLF